MCACADLCVSVLLFLLEWGLHLRVTGAVLWVSMLLLITMTTLVHGLTRTHPGGGKERTKLKTAAELCTKSKTPTKRFPAGPRKTKGLTSGQLLPPTTFPGLIINFGAVNVLTGKRNHLASFVRNARHDKNTPPPLLIRRHVPLQVHGGNKWGNNNSFLAQHDLSVFTCSSSRAERIWSCCLCLSRASAWPPHPWLS